MPHAGICAGGWPYSDSSDQGQSLPQPTSSSTLNGTTSRSQAFEAFPSGAQCELVARFHDRDLDPETWHPLLRDHRGLRIGVQFSDGRSGATELFAAHPRAMRPGEVLISPRGGIGHRDEHHMRMWLWPLPPPGPMGSEANY